MVNIKKGSKSLLKNLNRSIVINMIREKGPLPRVAIAKATGLERASITNIANYLLRKKLIKEVGQDKSSGGRRPTLLDINYNHRTVYGIKIEAERIIFGLTNLRGKIISRSEEKFPRGSKSQEILELIIKNIDRIIKSTNLLGIGIGVSGFVNLEKGISIYSPILNWKNVNLAKPLKERYRVPVFLSNDVNTLTLAEKWYGAGKKYKNFICITVGEGIGSGIVIDGKFYGGAIGGAGEIGHICIDINGPKCRCGETGCLEALASDYFLIEEAKKAIAQGKGEFKKPTPEELLQAAKCGDIVAKDIFKRMGRNLGIGAKNAVNLLNPEAIIVGGERIDAYSFFSPAFKEAVKGHSFPEEAKKLDIILTELGEDSWIIGAATLVIRDFFKLPL